MTPKIEIYGRDDCRFCAAARQFCERRRYAYVYHDASDPAVYAALVDRLGETPETVPQIFLGIHDLGGFEELRASEPIIQQIIGGE